MLMVSGLSPLDETFCISGRPGQIPSIQTSEATRALSCWDGFGLGLGQARTLVWPLCQVRPLKSPGQDGLRSGGNLSICLVEPWAVLPISFPSLQSPVSSSGKPGFVLKRTGLEHKPSDYQLQKRTHDMTTQLSHPLSTTLNSKKPSKDIFW